MPRHLAGSHVGGSNVHHDLVGFDPRGVGYSADLPCAADIPEPDPGLSDEEKARRTAARTAEANRKCFDAHPGHPRRRLTRGRPPADPELRLGR
jgi:hypothetical protein